MYVVPWICDEHTDDLSQFVTISNSVLQIYSLGKRQIAGEADRSVEAEGPYVKEQPPQISGSKLQLGKEDSLETNGNAPGKAGEGRRESTAHAGATQRGREHVQRSIA